MAIAKPGSIDEYIASFPQDTQLLLEQVRTTIRTAAPDAAEAISYGIPTFILNGTYLIYFAGYKKHISIYPAPRESDAFKNELSKYKGSKGTVQFPLDKPLPIDLITRLVTYCIQANKARRLIG